MTTIIDSTTQGEVSSPSAERRLRQAPSKRWNAVLKFIRRVHLYSGLFMFPWVLLYGLTGMFFNHPQAFTGGEVRSVSAVGGSLAELPTPEQTATDVVAAINEALTEQGSDIVPIVAFSNVRPPRYNRHLAYTVTSGEFEHAITVDPVTGAGEIRTKHIPPTGATPDNPLSAVGTVELKSNALTVVQAAISGVLEEHNLSPGEPTPGRRAPSLIFSVDIDGEPHVLSYNLANGALSTTSEDAAPTMDTKTFMQRMHLSRGYSPHWDIKWIWALLVDDMFASMAFWALSGLLMWFQIKRTRLLGAGFLAASLAVTTLLVIGMHDNLTVAGSRGHGPPPRQTASETRSQAAPGPRGGHHGRDRPNGEQRRGGRSFRGNRPAPETSEITNPEETSLN